MCGTYVAYRRVIMLKISFIYKNSWRVKTKFVLSICLKSEAVLNQLANFRNKVFLIYNQIPFELFELIELYY